MSHHDLGPLPLWTWGKAKMLWLCGDGAALRGPEVDKALARSFAEAREVVGSFETRDGRAFDIVREGVS